MGQRKSPTAAFTYNIRQITGIYPVADFLYCPGVLILLYQLFLTLQQLWIKSGFRYGLAYLVVSIVCTVLIVIGNDLLLHAAYKGALYSSILELDYRQWLPICALALAFAFGVYLLFARLLFNRLPVIISALLCATITCAIAILSGISPSSLQQYDWYEGKNLLIFFVAGFAFVWFTKWMD